MNKNINIEYLNEDIQEEYEENEGNLDLDVINEIVVDKLNINISTILFGFNWK